MEKDLATLSLAELRHRLTALADDPNHTDDLDPLAVLRYLATSPDSSHTADSAHALIQLTRIFGPAGQAAEMLDSALLAARVATGITDRQLLSRARNKQGIALVKLSRLAEATLAQSEAWLLARETLDKDRELHAVWGFSTIAVAMGQWDAAIRYCERMRVLAEELGLPQYEFSARNNLADCALQLGDSALALRTLNALEAEASRPGIDPDSQAHLHNNLARAWLLVGDIATANSHARKAAEWASVWRAADVISGVEAIQGLVDVRLGLVDSGLSAVTHALAFAKQTQGAEVPNCLGICIDAYEAAGRVGEALNYLHELVEWKRRAADAQVMALDFASFTDAGPSHTESCFADDGVIAKERSLVGLVQSHVERLREIALNAEIATGHDLYKPFRIANLARHLAASLGWDQPRIDALALGAQLCNIGMIAIPTRLLVKSDHLSEGERLVLRGHAQYGAELLRKSRLPLLDMAAVLAEQHHEHYDGTGYPNGLAAEAIAEEARIVAICDAFDAMTHEQPTRRPPQTVEVALNNLVRGSGGQFDPRLVSAFLKLIRTEFPRHNDFDAFLAEGAEGIEYVRVRARMDALISG